MRLKSKNILIIDNSVAVTGAINASLNASLNLKEDFNFIYILPTGSSALSLVQSKGFKLYTLPFIEISKRPRNLLLYLPYLLLNGIRVKRLAKQNQIEIIHMNDFYNLTGIVAKLLGAKVQLVTHVRFMPQKFMPSLSKVWATLNLKFADEIICVSQAVKSYFKNSAKAIVIYDPVPQSEKHPEKVVAKQGPEINLLYLSNFISGKGQDHALAAFRMAYKQNRNLRLLFAGGDMGLEKNSHFRQQLEDQVTQSGLSNIVRFESFVTDVEQKIKEADIVLNFSESESFSLTCLDALFYGTPLIATDCGGPAELFEDGQSGYLVPNKETELMACAILDLASDFDKRKRFAREGKEFVRKKFSVKRNYSEMLNIYRRKKISFSWG